jgi:hypothetical protein
MCVDGVVIDSFDLVKVGLHLARMVGQGCCQTKALSLGAFWPAVALKKHLPMEQSLEPYLHYVASLPKALLYLVQVEVELLKLQQIWLYQLADSVYEPTASVEGHSYPAPN